MAAIQFKARLLRGVRAELNNPKIKSTDIRAWCFNGALHPDNKQISAYIPDMNIFVIIDRSLDLRFTRTT